MTEIVMLVWLGGVARSVSFVLGFMLVAVLTAATALGVIACIDYDGVGASLRGFAWPTAVIVFVSALALALIPSRDTIYLYAAARAVQIAETTELGSEVYAALLRSLREVSPAK